MQPLLEPYIDLVWQICSIVVSLITLLSLDDLVGEIESSNFLFNPSTHGVINVVFITLYQTMHGC